MKPFYTLIKICMSFIFIAWSGGFLWYAEVMNRAPQDLETITDAIVVLTGGRNRVEEGFHLLKSNMAKKLFITGVYKHVSVEGLEKKHSITEIDSSKVELGYKARNTIGNAKETAQWMGQNHFKSLRLVTANYHMPRSLLEFKKYMPHIKVIPHRVDSRPIHQKEWWYWSKQISIMAKEYLKFLYVYSKDIF